MCRRNQCQRKAIREIREPLTVAEEDHKDRADDHDVEAGQEERVATECHELIQLDEADNLPHLVLITHPACVTIGWIYHQEKELESLKKDTEADEGR